MPKKGYRCPEGCTCGWHRKCESGCTCYRHRSQLPPPEVREENRQRRLEKQREYMRARRAADPEGEREQARRYQEAAGRKYFLKWKFGLTLERWDEMLMEQNNCCYLCLEPFETGATLPIHVDHDRGCCPADKSCGSCVRGLAHQKCNQGIGQFGDDPEKIRRIADNLEIANRRVRG